MILCIICVIIVGCSRVDNVKPEKIVANVYKKNDEQENSHAIKGHNNNNKGVESIIDLTFETIPLKPSNTIGQGDIIKVKDLLLNNYNMFVYSKIGSDEDEHYIGIHVNDTLYEIGEIAYIDTIDLTEVVIEDTTFIKVSGGLGANYPVHYYFTMENEVPIQYIHKELPIVIRDLDDDGTLEWVVNFGGLVAIYKKIDSEWKYVNLTQSTSMDLFFDEQEKKLYPRNPSLESYYVFRENKLLHYQKKD